MSFHVKSKDKQEYKTLAVRLTIEEAYKIESLAEKNGLTISAIIRQMFMYAMEGM